MKPKGHVSRLSRRNFLWSGTVGFSTGAHSLAQGAGAAVGSVQVPDKLVVLTFDDAVKSHRVMVAPLLKDLGFGATFFITHRWMTDSQNFMNWQDIKEIYEMGFEIGNHSWTHDGFSIPRNADRLAGELALIEFELKRVGIPKPISFAYCGNAFGPEAVKIVHGQGYKLARRGITPEAEYEFGTDHLGMAFQPGHHHPLLIPSAGIPDPCWTLEQFQRAAALATNGRIVVFQFHGVPDLAHPWCHTPPERFRAYMRFLKEQGFRVIAMRDLGSYIDSERPPADPVLNVRVPELRSGCEDLPVEVEATQRNLPYWLENMRGYHRYTSIEVEKVCGLAEGEIRKRDSERKEGNSLGLTKESEVRVLAYPGGRHPRLGFLDGAINPMRGTKASVFLPWDPASYVVVDVPEAIFSNLGLIFLAHTHIPTYWNERNEVLENIDWTTEPDGGLHFHRELPNGIVIGASIRVTGRDVNLELWIRNVTYTDLSGLRAQVCVMLKGAPEFNSISNENKLLRSPVAAVRSDSENR